MAAAVTLNEIKGLGHVAEWLRNGLQNRVPRFNSGRGLQPLPSRVGACSAAVVSRPLASNSATYRAGRIVRPPMRALARRSRTGIARFILDLELPTAPSIVLCDKTIAAMR